jgi:hypothetical protein
MKNHDPIVPQLSQNAIAVLEKRYLKKDHTGLSVEGKCCIKNPRGTISEGILCPGLCPVGIGGGSYL